MWRNTEREAERWCKIFHRQPHLSHLIRRVRLEDFYPPFLIRFLKLLKMATDMNLWFHVTSGYRSFDEQNEIFEQGRSLPGQIVTQAQGGQSLHNFGLAIDVVRNQLVQSPLVKPVWEKTAYEDLNKLSQEVDLEWGGNWNNFKGDVYHLQYPLEGIPIAKLKRIYESTYRTGSEKKALKEVWKYLEIEQE
jgi:hypothetical protein